MRTLKITGELSKRYLLARDSHNAARQALAVTLPDIPDNERHGFYMNAFRDLCDTSVRLMAVENEILETLNITGFEGIELDNVYTMEEEENV